MSDPLGLSIGTTNLVAASVGHQPVTRRSVLTLFGHSAPEVGTPGKDSDNGGVVLSGFVDRVGDPVPLVAADGETYPAEQLLVEALESMVGLAPPSSRSSTSDLVIAVPSYWSSAMSGALQTTLGASEMLAPGGVTPRLIPDALAALTALNANPGIDRHGTVALLDFGGGGTSITLADAASAFDVIDGTDRIPEFAGDQIDQALLSHLLEGITGDGDVDPGQTAAVGSLALLREQCRSAKERLSAETFTELTVDLPGRQADVRVTRAELEDLIERPLKDVLDALEIMLVRNNISWSAVSTVALVGGGAGIPLIQQRVAERSQARIVTTPQPALDAAAGAALFAVHGRAADTATWVAPAAPAPALAWSQDEGPDDVVPYAGAVPKGGFAPYSGAASDANAGAVPPNRYGPSEGFRSTAEPATADSDDVKVWQRLPLSVFGTAAAVALVTVGGVAIALTSVEGADREQPKPGIAPLSSAFVPSGPPGETITHNNQPVQPSPEPTAAVVPPNVVATTPVPPTAAPTSSTTTSPMTTSPTTTTATTTTTTTTATTTTPTTTTTLPTTTAPTTTAPTTTAPSTTPSTPTTAAAVTTTAPAATTAPVLKTSYLTIPFFPEPIPIPVLESP